MKKEIIIAENRDFKGIWIPQKLYMSRVFSPNEKFLLLEIYSLSKKNSCYASNSHFADFVGLKENTIQKMLAKFETLGYINRTFEYKDGNRKEIKRRWITLTQKFYDCFINENIPMEKNQPPHGIKSIEGGLNKINEGVDKNPEGSNNNLNNTNHSLSKTNLSITDKYAFPDKSEKGEDIYASSPEEKEGGKRKPNRFIPTDYSYEQLREHIMTPITQYIQTKFEDESDKADLIADIIIRFCKGFEERFGKKHKVPTDDACKTIVFQFFNPPDVLIDFSDFDSYAAMMEKYFQTDFNRYGGYDGKIEKSVSHFMSRKVRENLFYRTFPELY